MIKCVKIKSELKSVTRVRQKLDYNSLITRLPHSLLYVTLSKKFVYLLLKDVTRQRIYQGCPSKTLYFKPYDITLEYLITILVSLNTFFRNEVDQHGNWHVVKVDQKGSNSINYHNITLNQYCSVIRWLRGETNSDSDMFVVERQSWFGWRHSNAVLLQWSGCSEAFQKLLNQTSLGLVQFIKESLNEFLFHHRILNGILRS